MPNGTRMSGQAITGNRIAFMVVNEFEECTEELEYTGTITEQTAAGDLQISVTCVGRIVSSANHSGTFEATRVSS